MSHTDGPWFVEMDQYGSWPNAIRSSAIPNDNVIVLFDRKGFDMLSIPRDGDPTPQLVTCREATANAELMALAPQLKAKLALIARKIEIATNVVSGGGSFGLTPSQQRIILDALCPIAMLATEETT